MIDEQLNIIGLLMSEITRELYNVDVINLFSSLNDPRLKD